MELIFIAMDWNKKNENENTTEISGYLNELILSEITMSFSAVKRWSLLTEVDMTSQLMW